MPNENQDKAHYMKRGAALAYCGRTTQNVKVAYDDWTKVTCSDCLAHPAAPDLGIRPADKENP